VRAARTVAVSRNGSPWSAVLEQIQLLCGDLTLTADRAQSDASLRTFQADGAVVLKRGDETLRANGLRLVIDEGRFDATDAQLDTPPFFLRGARIAQTGRIVTAEKARVSLRGDGGGEVAFFADRVQIADANRLTLRNARLWLYGQRLFTIKHLSIPVQLDSRFGGGSGNSQPPLTFRVSQVSGTVFGLGGTFSPFPSLQTTVGVEQSTRQGVQYRVTARRALLPPPRVPDRGRMLSGVPGGADESLEGVSALRQLVTARPAPPPLDRILDFVDILSTPNPLSRPTRTPLRSLIAEFTLAGNREFTERRLSPLLLSRQPELLVRSIQPLSARLPANDNAAARRALRRPRPVLQTEFGFGTYTEKRIALQDTTVSGRRTTFGVGLQSLPVLVGERLLVSGAAQFLSHRYGAGGAYDVTELTLASDYVFSTRMALGAGLIRRATRGATPFLFDRVDTQNEAIVRGERMLPGGRWQVGALARYDTNQNKLFDFEIGVARRGSVVETRFSYRKLGGQLGFALVLPGISSP
jgi:hypothetical protein